MRTKSGSILSLCAFLAIEIGTAASSSIVTVIQPPVQDSFSLDQEHHWVLLRNRDKKEFLFRTDDGGTHWTSSAAPFNIWSLFFTDASEGWGIAAEQRGEYFDKFCIHSSDSGLTWQRLGAIARGREAPTGIAFDSGEHGWVVGEGVEDGASGAAFVMQTDDGGIHWTKLNWKTQPASGLYGVRLSNGRVLTWSAGSDGSGIYELRRGAPPRKISDRETMDMASSTNGPLYALSWSGVYRLTADSNDWEELLQPAEAGFHSLSFADSQRGCAAGNQMYCTHDGGRTWTHLGLPKIGREHDMVQIFRLCMIGEDSVWAVSENRVYEMSKGAGKWTRVEFFDKSGKPLDSLRRE